MKSEFTFTQKKIFIFSPEPWSNMRLSKHHYAETLAQLGNQVFFLEPANQNGTKISLTEINDKLQVVNYPLKAKGWGKLPGWIYRFLVQREMNMLESKLGTPDIVWCFDPIKLVHLSTFSKAFKIYHPVDQFDPVFLNAYKFKVDIAFSTMQKEVALLKSLGYKAYFVQHGLSAVFEPYAQKRLQDLNVGGLPVQSETIQIGFAGNLMGDALDRQTIHSVIEQHQDCHFRFWGKYDSGTSSGNNEKAAFIEFLQQASNVSLLGAIPTVELARQMQDIDMFWVCWKKSDSPVWNENTNPHKIIEYLSTGVPVVSHYMHTYKDSKLIYMIHEQDGGEEYLRLFSRVKNELRVNEFPEIKKQRIQYALDNMYIQQVHKIASYIRGELSTE